MEKTATMHLKNATFNDNGKIVDYVEITADINGINCKFKAKDSTTAEIVKNFLAQKPAK